MIRSHHHKNLFHKLIAFYVATKKKIFVSESIESHISVLLTKQQNFIVLQVVGTITHAWLDQYKRVVGCEKVTTG